MNVQNLVTRARFCKIPSVFLAVILQVVPLAKNLFVSPAMVTSPFAIVSRWALTAFAYLEFDTIAGATSITSPTAVNATNGVPFKYVITTSPTYVDMVYTSSGFPAGINNLNNSGYPNFTITGTPNATNKTYTATVTVSASGYPTISQNVAVTLLAPPSPPTNSPVLKVKQVSTSATNQNQLVVSWTTNSTMNQSGFKLFGGPTSEGPFVSIGTSSGTSTNYSIFGAFPSTTYYYEIIATNGAGVSPTSAVASITTTNFPPVWNAFSTNQAVTNPATLTFTATASDIGENSAITFGNFSNYVAGTANVLFQSPTTSPKTSGFISSGQTTVTNTFPSGHSSKNVVEASWTWVAGTTAPWLRLRTTSAASLQDPIIDFRRVLRFDIYTTAPLAVGLGLLEDSPTNIIGTNGGSAGVVDWSGVTNSIPNSLGDITPNPTTQVSAGSWQTLQFNIPTAPVTAFTGSGTLVSTNGLGVLEHLALVPTDSSSSCSVYVDNVAVVYTNLLTYSLGGGAPAGASINSQSGVFTWAPTSAQGGVFNIPIVVTDNGVPPMSATQLVTVTVTAPTNGPPTLSPIPNQIIEAGATLTITNSATQTNNPVQTLIFSLDPGFPSGATIDPASGIFSWTPAANSAQSTNSITVRVTGNGSPPYSAAQTFTATVVSRALNSPAFDSSGNLTLTWNTIAGRTYIVEYTAELTNPNWIPLSTNIVADGSPLSFSDSIADGTNRFYMIFEVQ